MGRTQALDAADLCGSGFPSSEDHVVLAVTVNVAVPCRAASDDAVHGWFLCGEREEYALSWMCATYTLRSSLASSVSFLSRAASAPSRVSCVPAE